MGRLVRKPRLPDLDAQLLGLDSVLRGRSAGVATPVVEPGDNYLERMAKYIPAEVLGFFMLINAILDQAMKSGGPDAAMAGFPVLDIAIGALIVACCVTPLFCWYVRDDGDAWITNAAVSTIAFPFWAYLMGAVAFERIHDGNLAVILVLSFTVVSGLVSPPAPRPQAAAVEQPEATVADIDVMAMPQQAPTTRLIEALA
jgi:hypothetical protein